MSGTTTTSDAELTQNQIIIISVVCSVFALILLAVILRVLLPCYRRRKHQTESDDRSLVHATTSVGSDQHFYYSGPVVPDREPITSTQTITTTTREQNPTYINVAREEFENNPVWISGVSHQFSREESPVRQESHHTETIVREEYHQESQDQGESDQRLGQHSRQTSSNIELGMYQGSPRPARYTRQKVDRQDSPRIQRLVKDERVVRQESARLHREMYVRDTNPRIREVYHEYDIPPKYPREVRQIDTRQLRYSPERDPPRGFRQMETREFQYSPERGPPREMRESESRISHSVQREPLREVPNQNVRRTTEYSRSQVQGDMRNDNQPTEPPPWINHALQISDPGFITRSVAPPPGSTIAPSMTVDNHRVLTREELSGFKLDRQTQLSAQEMLNNRKYLNYSIREDWTREEDSRIQQEKYEHFSKQNPPGRREVYHQGRDAMRTQEMKDFIKRDKYSPDIRKTERRTEIRQTSYPANGHVAGGNNRHQRHQTAPASQPEGFVPVDNKDAPSKLPAEYNREHRKSIETADQLNRELTTFLSGSPLRPLDMSDKYRENWDNQYDPYRLQDRALNHYTHPSENRAFPEPETKEWHQIHQERLAPASAPSKGKKGKGKAK